MLTTVIGKVIKVIYSTGSPKLTKLKAIKSKGKPKNYGKLRNSTLKRKYGIKRNAIKM